MSQIAEGPSRKGQETKLQVRLELVRRRLAPARETTSGTLQVVMLPAAARVLVT